MVFNVTFSNISAISWRSVLLMEETGVPEKKTPTILFHLMSDNNKVNHILMFM